MKRLWASLVSLVTVLFVTATPLAANAHPTDPGSTELAATGSVLGAFELIVGGAGTVLLIGAVLLTLATRRTTRNTSAQ